MRSTSFKMRSARNVMSSRLPMGVPTMYRQPPPGAAPFDGGADGLWELPAARFLLIARSLTPVAKAIVARMVYSAIPHEKKESVCAFVRVQMPEMRPQDGKNRKYEWPAFEEVPALRRQSGSAVFRARDSIQRLGMVRDGLRRQKVRRFRERGKGGRIQRLERVSEGFRCEGFGVQRTRFQGFIERFRKQRKENRQIRQIGAIRKEEINSTAFAPTVSTFSNSCGNRRPAPDSATPAPPSPSRIQACRRRHTRRLRRCKPRGLALAPTGAGRR